jgi:hypothetical protein
MRKRKMTTNKTPLNWDDSIELDDYRETIEGDGPAQAIDVVEREDGWIVGIRGVGAFGPWSKDEAIAAAFERGGAGDAVILNGIKSDDAELLAVKQCEAWSSGHGPADVPDL